MIFTQKMQSVLVFLIVILFSNAASAQENITREQLQNLGQLSSVIGTRKATKTSGSPYLNQKFLEGKVQLNKNTYTKTIFLRLNTYKNQLEFLRNKEVLVTEPSKINGFTIFTNKDDITFKNGYSVDGEVGQDTFLRVIYDGNIKLLAYHYTKLIKDMPSYSDAVTNNKFVKGIKYYLSIDNTYKDISLEKNSIMEALSGSNDHLKKYAKENALSFKKEQDVADILAYYDKQQ